MVNKRAHPKYSISCSLLLALQLMGCGGGGEKSTPAPPPEPVYNILGSAVKGPLQFSVVKLYVFDKNKVNGLGSLISSGSTDHQAKIQQLSIIGNTQEHYVIEFSTNETTIDITTGKSPVIPFLRTIVSGTQIKENEYVYATPLSTLILKLTLVKLNNGTDIKDALFSSEQEVKSIFGFGANDDVDLLKTPPIFTTTDNSIEAQLSTLKARVLNEANASLIYQLFNKVDNKNILMDELLTDITNDISDGSLDASSEGKTLSYKEEDLSLFSQTLNTLTIPNSESLVFDDIKEIMTSETSKLGFTDFNPELIKATELKLTHSQVILNIDIDNDGVINNQDLDNDNDGYLDINDAFPLDAQEWSDNDFDDIGDNADTDDDNDGFLDSEDAFPLDKTEWLDTDLDGLGNNADPDDDNDGVLDADDVFPLDPTEQLDNDNDGIGNNADPDDDNDGTLDTEDAFPFDASESLDTDNDGLGNNADPDDDNDGYLDINDAFPLDKTEWIDTDLDGIGNNQDSDDDNDGVNDNTDAFPLDPTEQLDTDNDGLGNNADPDDDNDGYLDHIDAFPFDNNEWLDTDLDGVGNNQDSDDDGDGTPDATDAFPLDPTEQLDTDNDGLGNNADPDDDNDGYLDSEDAFPFDKTEWLDTDLDGIGNNKDDDDDNDGVLDNADLFPLDSTEQSDNDNDGQGDNADTDDDNDGYLDSEDAFPFDKTEWLDTDLDGVGNNQDDDDDNDGVSDDADLFPLDSTEQSDNDNDGLGDNSDPDDDNDGVLDADDVFPLDSTEQLDNDSDGVGNNLDPDDDNDGILDINDAFPFDATESLDTDNDGQGDNADTDDDNDGFIDSEDAFPFDNTEWLDTDLDGIGNNQDNDDDNDGTPDNEDAFPLDSTEQSDNDLDGIGNNSDLDDDNDGILDTQDDFPFDADNDGILDIDDNITLVGVKENYTTGEQVDIKVRGKDINQTVLTSKDGWHIQYYTYDLSNPENHIIKYIQDGYYNAQFNSESQEWLVQFPAVEYSGQFKTKILLYCSKPDSMCGGEYRNIQWEQEFNYDVTCSGATSCEYTPDPEPGVNITNNQGSAEVSSAIARSNGDIFTTYRLFDKHFYSAISNSKNSGSSWELNHSFNFSSTSSYLYEDSNHNLLMLANCENDLCIFKYTDNQQWQQLSRIDFSEYSAGSYSVTENSIIQTNDGNYLLSFSQDNYNLSTRSNIFVLKSNNLVDWSTPIQVSNEEEAEVGSKLIQLNDGTLMLAYNSYARNSIIVKTSLDGDSWTESQEISGFSSNISLIKDNDKVRLFYSSYGKFYTQYLNDDALFVNKELIRNINSFGPFVIKMPDGTFSIVYSLDLNEQRDVFFENIGTFN